MILFQCDSLFNPFPQNAPRSRLPFSSIRNKHVLFMPEKRLENRFETHPWVVLPLKRKLSVCLHASHRVNWHEIVRKDCIPLQNIVNNFDKEQTGYHIISEALESMTSVTQHINEMKRKHEHAVRIQEIQSQLSDWEGADLTTYGDLVLEVRNCVFVNFTRFTFVLIPLWRKHCAAQSLMFVC